MKLFKITTISLLLLLSFSCSKDSDEEESEDFDSNIYSVEFNYSMDERYDMEVFVSSGLISVKGCSGEVVSSFDDTSFTFENCTITTVDKAPLFHVRLDYSVTTEYALEEENFTSSNGIITGKVRKDGMIIDTFSFQIVPNERNSLDKTYPINFGQ